MLTILKKLQYKLWFGPSLSNIARKMDDIWGLIPYLPKMSKSKTRTLEITNWQFPQG